MARKLNNISLVQLKFVYRKNFRKGEIKEILRTNLIQKSLISLETGQRS